MMQQARLADPPPVHRAVLPQERRADSGAIMIVDDKVPEFDKHAGGHAVFHYIRLLVEHGFKVTYVPHDRVATQPYTRILQRLGVEVLYGRVHVEAWLMFHGHELDHVLLARPTVAPDYIDMVRRRTEARLVYYTHDLHFLREMRRFESGGEPTALEESHRFRAIEERIFRDVDAVTTPSADEVPVIEALAPGTPAGVIPLYALRSRSTDVGTVPLADRDSIIFVGGSNHPPNLDAARFLVEEIMPIVWREVPTAHLVLAGSDPSQGLLALAGDRISVLGYVPDLGPYLGRARVSVNPMRYGAGVKGKIISSLEAGVPVVTTSIGNEGIGLGSEVEALIGDSAEQIAAHVVRLFHDPKLLLSLAAAGHSFVMESFGEETTRDQLLAALGLVFCPVCGRRSALEEAWTVAGASRLCSGCGADPAASRLADVVVRPYRQYGGVSIREAARHLAPLSIVARDIGDPISQIMASLPSFQTAPTARKRLDGTVDLLMSGDTRPTETDMNRTMEEGRRLLRVGGRLTFVLLYGGAEEDGHAAQVPSPATVRSRLEDGGFRVVADGRTTGIDGTRLVAFDALRDR